jgi:hypothetical protein
MTTEDGDTPGTSVLVGVLAALEDAVAVLREQLGAANARAEAKSGGVNLTTPLHIVLDHNRVPV